MSTPTRSSTGQRASFDQIVRGVAVEFEWLLRADRQSLTSSEQRSLRLLRELMGDEACVSARDRRWIQRAREWAEAAESNAVQPLKLTTWAHNQRTRSGQSEVQLHLLSSLPGWDWAPSDSHWQRRFDATSLFVECEGREPRVRSLSAAERGLAHWVARQRRLVLTGRLPHLRLVAIRDGGPALRRLFGADLE